MEVNKIQNKNAIQFLYNECFNNFDLLNDGGETVRTEKDSYLLVAFVNCVVETVEIILVHLQNFGVMFQQVLHDRLRPDSTGVMERSHLTIFRVKEKAF